MAVTHPVLFKHFDGRDVIRAGPIVLINDRALFWDNADIIEILSGISRDRDLDLLRGRIDDYFQFRTHAQIFCAFFITGQRLRTTINL